MTGISTKRCKKSPGERGVLVLEAAILVPIAMLLFLLIVQMALWAHAGTVVQAAATQGDEAASMAGGTAAQGASQADSVLSSAARSVVVNPSVRVQMLTGGIVEVQVTGTTESIIPWLHLSVTATRVAPEQEFRASG